MPDDVRYALRQLRLSPGFAVVAIVTLALATGANTAFFSLFHALVLRPLPLDDADRLVAVVTTDDGGQLTGFPVPLADALKEEPALFDGAAAFLGGGVFTLSASGLAPLTGIVDFVTADYFSTLRLAPHLGRLLDASDADDGNAPAHALVLSHRFWLQRLGGDPAVIGRQVELNGEPFTVVGVTPPGFFGLWIEVSADVIAPMSSFPRVFRGLVPGQLPTAQAAVARLRHDVTVEQASARLQTLWPTLIEGIVTADLPASRQDALRRNRPRVDRLATGFSYMRDSYTRPLQLLIALTAWMLIVGCVNLAGLLLARAAARDREIATRLALGASRWRLVRQALVEGILLSCLGTACGLPLAWWGARSLSLLFGADYLVPLTIDVAPNGRVLALSALATLATGAIFAIVPASRAAGRHGSEALGTTRTIARGSTAWGNRLLIGQFALSLTLLLGAAALVQSLARIRDLNPGFQTSGLHSAALVTVPGQAAEGATGAYLRTLLSAVAAMPGIASAALTDTRPAGGYVRVMDVARLDQQDTASAVRGNLDMVSPGYFATMGIPLEAGREFAWFDDVSSPRVAIISASLAHRLFPEGGAIGSRIRVGSDPTRQSMEIVAIAGDASVRDIRQTRPFNVFIALAQEARPTMTPDVVIRSAGSAPREQDVRLAVEPLGRHRVRQMWAVDELVDRLLLRERLMAGFGTFFAALAAMLIAIGLYGLLAFAVRVRTREIGVRLAVGASPSSVLAMIVKHGVRLAVIGLIVGLPFSIYAGRLLKDHLFEAQATDPWLLASVATFVLVLTVAAAYFPARFASRVDPATALRAE